ncbi:MAG: hypothetical protein ACLP56_04305, partial [Candidatus Sulfotelmatobacter sp.]
GGEGGYPRLFSGKASDPTLAPTTPQRAPNFIFRSESTAMKTVNLKSDMPQVHEALQRMDRELAVARQEKAKLLKLIHGYGSTGAGGDIRIAVQKRLLEMAQNGQIRGCIFGEDWSKSDDAAWKLLQSHPDLKSDSDLGRRNRGITIVLL